jgi:hypothetical protein
MGHDAKKRRTASVRGPACRRCSRFQALSERAHANPNIHSALRLSLAAAPVPLLKAETAPPAYDFQRFRVWQQAIGGFSQLARQVASPWTAAQRGDNGPKVELLTTIVNRTY